jgi:CRP/FNR family cyclic AMP-dependent transcriptional regulator
LTAALPIDEDRRMAGPPTELIRSVPFFAHLSDKDADELAAGFVQHDYAPGDVILIEGEQGYAFFVVESGEARVSHHGELAGSLGPGTPFGELALFVRGSKRSATITAEAPTRCWSLPIYIFRPFVEARPALAWDLLEYLAGQLRVVQERPAEPV